MISLLVVVMLLPRLLLVLLTPLHREHDQKVHLKPPWRQRGVFWGIIIHGDILTWWEKCDLTRSVNVSVLVGLLTTEELQGNTPTQSQQGDKGTRGQVRVVVVVLSLVSLVSLVLPLLDFLVVHVFGSSLTVVVVMDLQQQHTHASHACSSGGEPRGRRSATHPLGDEGFGAENELRKQEADYSQSIYLEDVSATICERGVWRIFEMTGQGERNADDQASSCRAKHSTDRAMQASGGGRLSEEDHSLYQEHVIKAYEQTTEYLKEG
ncbi:hypothetical protein EYF80_047945 [Liparis tanakae]|uniref:Uncharacterized protein n=1 Tax=Liparis tanakae TaxID=230148 RepID=A0A4Z2FL58_9TELE|nr:hypothetical protein EYF80_047945 [Liparis tanakae]